MHIILFIFLQNCFAFNTQNDWSPGKMALAYEKTSHFWLRFDLGLFDGSITTQPSESKAVDRRIEQLTVFGAEQAINPRIGLRFNFLSETSQIRKSESKSQSQIADTRTIKLTPSIDATFITDAGLEVFVGLAMPIYPVQKTVISAPDGTSNLTFGSASMVTPRAGFTRQGGGWAGALYYSTGRETTRDIARSDSNGNVLDSSDNVYQAPVIGVCGEVRGAASFDFEIDSVQEGGGGQKTETGNNVRSDYIKIFLGSTVKMEPASIKFGLAHQTLSYSDSSYISIDSIPTSSGRVLLILNEAKNYFFLGGILGYGQDRQSLPEINAAYKMVAFSATTGFFLLW